MVPARLHGILLPESAASGRQVRSSGDFRRFPSLVGSNFGGKMTILAYWSRLKSAHAARDVRYALDHSAVCEFPAILRREAS